MTAHPFVTGGPVPPDSPVYIERAADLRIRQHVRRMEYVTLVEPRQQGKTSLIHHLTRTLGPGSILTYANAMRLDKTNEADWYASLCRRLLRKIPFISDGDCPSLPHNGSTWGNFLAALAEVAEATGHNLIIALDELGDVWMDWRLGFFSNIRAIFDERPNEPRFRHLTFVLAGTYSPRALIGDPRTSPFNVAQRAPLPDFTLSQTGDLVSYLGLTTESAVVVARRIHYWTDGQPYLTQRLCRTLAEGEVPSTPEGVDLAVDRLYREDTNHLPRILEALDPEKHSRLRVYVKRVLAGHRPQFRPASEGRYHGPLALIGVLKADDDGRCKVRNRIYEQALREVEKDQIGGQVMAELPPEVKSKAISFLIDIGRWAVSELKEKWKLARQKKDVEQPNEIDLSDPEEKVTRDSEVVLQDIAAEHGIAEVERVLGLVERKHNLILEWKEMKVDNEEAFNRQELARSAYRLRQQELDQKIGNTMAEIEVDLKGLGLEVKKGVTD